MRAGNNGNTWTEKENARREKRRHLQGAAGTRTSREQKPRTKRKRAIDVQWPYGWKSKKTQTK